MLKKPDVPWIDYHPPDKPEPPEDGFKMPAWFILLGNGAILAAIGFVVWLFWGFGINFVWGFVAGVVAYETFHRLTYGSWL